MGISFFSIMATGINCTFRGIFEKFTILNPMFAIIAASVLILMFISIAFVDSDNNDVIGDILGMGFSTFFLSFVAALCSGNVRGKDHA